MPDDQEPTYGRSTSWQPERARFRLFPLLVSWIATGVALMAAAWLLPGVDIKNFAGALGIAVIVAALNAVIPPVLAALRLPLTLVLGFLLVLIARLVDPQLGLQGFSQQLLFPAVLADTGKSSRSAAGALTLKPQ